MACGPALKYLVNFYTKSKIDPLQRAYLKSKIMSVKNVKLREFIGYWNYFLAERNMKVASIPIGYSHGYSRSWSTQGRVPNQGQQ
jgi:alanine racemase